MSAREGEHNTVIASRVSFPIRFLSRVPPDSVASVALPGVVVVIVAHSRKNFYFREK